MNQRENAQESLRLNRGACLLLLMACIWVSGCALASETGRVFYLAKRTTQIEPKFYRYIRSDRLAQREARKLAEQAWAEYVGTSDMTDFSPDFENGFVEGFADYLYRGGSGEPPVIPPRGYWNLRFLNQFGKVSIDDWYEGFRQGARDCESRGLREMWVVPTSLISDQPEEDKHAEPLIIQPEHQWMLSEEADGPDQQAMVAPAPETETAEPDDESVPDLNPVEQAPPPAPLDEELEPPNIEDDEALRVDDSLSIRKVQPAAPIPAQSTQQNPEDASIPVVRASNQVEVSTSGEQENLLANEFRKLQRRAKATENMLRAPAKTSTPERLRLVFEQDDRSAPKAPDAVENLPAIPLEVSPPTENRKSPQLSAPTNWQPDGRSSKELPLKVNRSIGDATQQHDPASGVSPQEQEFDELDLLLKSADDAQQLPRIVHKSNRADAPSSVAEGTNVIRWRIRD